MSEPSTNPGAPCRSPHEWHTHGQPGERPVHCARCGTLALVQAPERRE